MRNLITKVTSISNERIKRVRALALKKNRDAEKVFVVEGAEHVQKALANGWQIETLLFNEDVENQAATQEIIKLSAAQNAALYAVNDKVASYASNRDNAQAVIAVFAQKYHEINSLTHPANAIWLGLENIRDAGNLGTIIRTADAVGVHAILLIGHTCDAFSPEVIRATTGSFSAVPLVQISLADFIACRKSFAGEVIGTHLQQNSVNYRDIEPKIPTLLLMGGEQSGLSAEISGVCDVLAKIPMRAGVESLNLAISTAIMLYQLSYNPRPKTT